MEECLFFFLDGKHCYACKLSPKSELFKQKIQLNLELIEIPLGVSARVLLSQFVKSEGKTVPFSYC